MNFHTQLCACDSKFAGFGKGMVIMMKKKMMAVLLSTAMCVTLFTGCGDQKTTPETQTPEQQTEQQSEQQTEQQSEAPAEKAEVNPMEQIVDSRYAFSYPVEGMDDMVQFYHFYGDTLGIGATFYASYAWNQITFSGTYTVEEAEFPYELPAEKADDAAAEKGTAPYTIIFYDMEGNELDKAGYDGEHLFNATTKINTDPMTGGGQFIMNYVDDETFTKYQTVFEGEVGTAYAAFVNPEDASATVTLNTNGTYQDMVIMMVEGTWVKEGENYTLTPASESDNGAAIEVGADGTYTYKSADGTEVTLSADNGSAEGFKFAGTIQVQGMDADLVLTTYEDGTCKAIASMAEMSLDIDQGTFVQGEDGFSFTFTFDHAGEIVSELGGDTGVQVHYVQTGNEQVGDVDTMLAVVLPQ